MSKNKNGPAPFVVVVHPSDGRRVYVRFGDSGFWPYRPAEYRIINVAPDLADSYLAGSMFSWHVPAAAKACAHHYKHFE